MNIPNLTQGEQLAIRKSDGKYIVFSKLRAKRYAKNPKFTFTTVEAEKEKHNIGKEVKQEAPTPAKPKATKAATQKVAAKTVRKQNVTDGKGTK